MTQPNPGYLTVDGVEYVTTAEAAERLGNDITTDMIRDWTKRGLLKPVGRYGGRSNIYRLADVARAERNTRVERRGRTRRVGELQKDAEWGQNLPTDGQVNSAQKPVKHPRCTVLRGNGRDCNRYAVPDAPFRICQDHMHEAYLHWKDAHPEAPRVEVVTQGPECISRGECISKLEKRKVVPRVETREPFVYYIRFRDRIKIGCTLNPTQRLSALPHDELLAVEPGSYDLERMRHQQFKAHRITTRGEWFRMHPDLLAHIDMLVKHFGAAEAYLDTFGIRLTQRSPIKDSA